MLHGECRCDLWHVLSLDLTYGDGVDRVSASGRRGEEHGGRGGARCDTALCALRKARPSGEPLVAS